jgi:WD40 repeat protein
MKPTTGKGHPWQAGLVMACVLVAALPLAAREPKLRITLENVHTRKDAPHLNGAGSLAFSPDCKILASAGRGGKSITLWDVKSGKSLAALEGHSEAVAALVFSPDCKTLVSGSWDKTVKLWDIASLKEIATLKGHAGPVRSVVFSPDGKALASGGGSVKLWDIASRKNTVTLKAHSVLAFSPDGKTLFTGERGSSSTSFIRSWDAASGKQVKEWKGPSYVTALAMCPRGKTLARVTQRNRVPPNLRLFDVGMGEISNPRHLFPFHGGPLAFNPSGTILVTRGEDNTITFRDVASGKKTTTLKGHTGPVVSLVFSPDGKVLASGSSYNTIKLWGLPVAKKPDR